MKKAEFTIPNKKKPPNSERAEVINQLLEFMEDDRFKYWLGRTNHLSVSGIHQLMKEARPKNKPPAYLNWLLKNSDKYKK